MSAAFPFPPLRRLTSGFVAIACVLLVGCDQLGIESATTVAARKEAEGKAIGAGCRHAARSVEQCYGTNKRADKAAVFAGWKEMNDYMRENKIDAVPAPPEVAVAVAPDVDTADSADEKAAGKPVGKAAARPAVKH